MPQRHNATFGISIRHNKILRHIIYAWNEFRSARFYLQNIIQNQEVQPWLKDWRLRRDPDRIPDLVVCGSDDHQYIFGEV